MDQDKKEKKPKKEKKVKLKSEIVKARERNIKLLKLILLIIALFLILLYFLLRIAFEQGAFTIILDQDLAKKTGLVMYESIQTKESRRILSTPRPEFIDNISKDWLPKDINDEADGTHNGENYLAYTFYLENQGDQTINYRYGILIDEVVKNVDTAMRIMLYINGEPITYAKEKSNGEPEPNTTKFYSDTHVLFDVREGFKVGEIDKFTVVIWIEGDDPQCTDELIGGAMKMHFEITEEHIKE